MTLEQNGVLRYGHLGEFLDFFRDRMANFKVNTNVGQNKFEVLIFNHWPKWPSIGTK